MKLSLSANVATALVAALLSGCAMSDDIGPDDGRSFSVSDRSYAEVWEAGVLTVGSIGEIASANRETGEIRGFAGASAWSWGNSLGVFISPPSDGARDFTVSVVGIRMNRVQISGSDYTGTMEAMMQARLDRVK